MTLDDRTVVVETPPDSEEGHLTLLYHEGSSIIVTHLCSKQEFEEYLTLEGLDRVNVVVIRAGNKIRVVGPETPVNPDYLVPRPSTALTS